MAYSRTRSPKYKKPNRSRQAKSRQAKSPSKKGVKLIRITKSPKQDKKLVAIFSNNGRIKQVHFGAKGMSDYSKHKDSARRARYLKRHSARENWNNPMSAGSLSKFILWGESTSIPKNIASFKRKFKL